MHAPQINTVGSLPIEQLRATFAKLRPGENQGAPEQLAELPLRVAPATDGGFEVLHGFKRLDLLFPQP